jgi:hypothetical protein
VREALKQFSADRASRFVVAQLAIQAPEVAQRRNRGQVLPLQTTGESRSASLLLRIAAARATSPRPASERAKASATEGSSWPTITGSSMAIALAHLPSAKASSAKMASSGGVLPAAEVLRMCRVHST